MKFSNPLVVIALLLIVHGCAISSKSTGANISCKTQLEYSGYRVTIKGLEIPVKGMNNIHLGKLEMAPEKIQEAKDLTQALDLIQFSDCQTMLMLKSDEAILTVRKHRDATIKALGDILVSLSAAENISQHEQIVNEGKKQLQILESTKP